MKYRNHYLALRSAAKYGIFQVFDRLHTTPDRFMNVDDTQEVVFELTAVIRIKNEARFLPELIAHHILLGVQHFYLYNNNSDDDPVSVLKPFIDSNHVTIIDWPQTPVCPSCYQHFFKTYGNMCRWVAFIDADEFIVEKEEGDLLKVLSESGHLPALAINWQYFGSSYHQKIPQGLVIENFIRSEPWLNRHVKLVVQPSQVRHFVNTHSFTFSTFTLPRTDDGRRALGTRTMQLGSPRLQINHYLYRSKENFLFKAGIGYGDKAGPSVSFRNKQNAEDEFKKYNQKQEKKWANRYASRVRELLSEFGYRQPYI